MLLFSSLNQADIELKSNGVKFRQLTISERHRGNKCRPACLRTHVTFQITTLSQYRRLAEGVRNILIAKHSAAWQAISLLARSLFRLLDQSQAL